MDLIARSDGSPRRRLLRARLVAGALTLAMGASVVVVAAPVGEPARLAAPPVAPHILMAAHAPRDDGPEVFGFLPYWLLEDALAAMDLDRLTTLAWFGVEANGVGELVKAKPRGVVPPGWAGFESQPVRDLQARAQAAGVDVVITVQRFGWTEGGARRTEALLTDPAARARLAEGVAGLVAERGLDGVNLDVEPLTPEFADDYVELVREVRAALDGVGPGLQLTVDVTTSLRGYDLAGLTADGAADAAIVMGYNYRGAGSPIAGSHAPLDDPSGPDLRETVDAALAEVDGDRLILALPWYGRAWSTESGEAGSATLAGEGYGPSVNLAYAAAAELAQAHGRRDDPAQASAWTAYPDRACETCPDAWRQVWYDDPDTFGAKVDDALSTGLRGVGIWALGYEAGRPELWDALRYRLDGIADGLAPVGEADLAPQGVLGEQEGRPAVGREVALELRASDEPGGSGLGYVRLSASGEVGDDGSLAFGRTYPAAPTVSFPLDDPSLGGDVSSGPRTIHVQWRDLAGNWSQPVTVEAWAGIGA